MSVYVFALRGKVPPAITQLSTLFVRSDKPGRPAAAVKGVHLVTKEAEWGSTDFYCTTAGLTAQLERHAIRLHARIIYLPDMAEQFSQDLRPYLGAHRHCAVRLATPADAERMLALIPAPSLPLFDGAA